MPLPLITPTNAALPKLLGAALTAVAAFVYSAPPVLHTTAAAASWLLITDYITGIAAAAISPDDKVTSSEMRLKMQKKLLCYFQILSFGGAISLMSQSWVVFTAAWGSVAASEGYSIIENIRASATAPEMAPIREFLDKAVGLLRTNSPQFPQLPDSPSPVEAKKEEAVEDAKD